MGRKKLLHGFTGMVARPILHDKDMLCGLGQDIEQKGGIALSIEPTRMRFGEQAPGEIVNQPQDLIGLSDTTGGNFGLVSRRAQV